MFKLFGSKNNTKKSDFEIEEDPKGDESGSEFIRQLQVNLSRLIIYAESADVVLQREVAEKLANEAVKPARQVQIVQFGGLKLLVPLTKSADPEVQRLSAHALANLSVNADNQNLMAEEGGIECLIRLLDSKNELTQRQAAKALANLGVSNENKPKIAEAGGIPKLVGLAANGVIGVRIEAIAALANLAVNDNNEIEIVKANGLQPIIAGADFAATELEDFSNRTEREITQLEELATQCARALRNLSVNPVNKAAINSLGGASALLLLGNNPNERISQQAKRALRNLENFSK